MTTSDKSKASRQDRLRQVVAGATKHFQATATFTLAGASYTVATLSQLCQSDVAANDAATQARATWLTTVQTQRDVNAKTDPVLRAFKAYVVSLYGDTATAGTTLADFGYTPRKPRSTDVAAKATAAVKARATRAARGTLGAVQKKAITGATPKPATPATPTPQATTTPPATPGTPVSSVTPTVTPVHGASP